MQTFIPKNSTRGESNVATALTRNKANQAKTGCSCTFSNTLVHAGLWITSIETRDTTVRHLAMPGWKKAAYTGTEKGSQESGKRMRFAADAASTLRGQSCASLPQPVYHDNILNHCSDNTTLRIWPHGGMARRGTRCSPWLAGNARP